MHYDNAEITLNVNIGGTWEGSTPPNSPGPLFSEPPSPRLRLGTARELPRLRFPLGVSLVLLLSNYTILYYILFYDIILCCATLECTILSSLRGGRRPGGILWLGHPRGDGSYRGALDISSQLGGNPAATMPA